jgi:hypothetical protein
MAGLPKWGVLAGLGALVGAATAAGAGVPGEVRLLVAGDKVYLSERGGPFAELALGATDATAQLRARLKEMLPDGGVATFAVGGTIVAEGGASGKWSPPTSGSQARRDGK